MPASDLRVSWQSVVLMGGVSWFKDLPSEILMAGALLVDVRLGRLAILCRGEQLVALLLCSNCITVSTLVRAWDVLDLTVVRVLVVPLGRTVVIMLLVRVRIVTVEMRRVMALRSLCVSVICLRPWILCRRCV